MKPTRVMLRRDKYRVVEGDTNKLARNKQGTIMDSGGHTDKEKAQRQADHINGVNK